MSNIFIVVLVFVSLSHSKLCKFESGVVIGQFDVLRRKQPAQKLMRGHVELSIFRKKRQKSDNTADFSKQQVVT